MAEENTAPTPPIEATDSPPKAAGGDSSVTYAEAGEPIPGAVPDAPIKAVEDITPVAVAEAGDVIPAATPARPSRYEEPHSEAHPHFRWHADALVEGHVYRGVVKDISTQGANLLLDHNVQNAKSIKLHIHVPPLDVTSPHHVLEVSGKIISTIYDGSEDAFRSGIIFLQFTRESDRTYLQSRILER
ncbi:MAG: hypothetical protein FD173_265 [Gallionellaceae bacterium]|nr:MAG: hypothetical protein FD173_265 [Gallionellaceae bacterium]